MVAKTDLCCVCNRPLGFGSGLIELGKLACDPCRTRSLAIRKLRWDSSKAGTNAIYSRLRSELRVLYVEVNAARYELKGLNERKDAIRKEAADKAEKDISELPFLKRLKLLFFTKRASHD